MAGHSFFAALLVAVHSFSPAIASDLPSTITIAPEARQTPYDLAKRQAFTTYETTSALPLTQYIYPFDEIPYQVNPYMMGRGPQLGTNQCNSSTEGPNSLCQTIMMNNISDFCIWGSPDPDDTIANTEAKVVGYCTQPGHGTRILAAGALTGVQFMKTSAYIQVTGHINMSAIGLQLHDTGGELDPHGDDGLGNPVGGLYYSNNVPSTAMDPSNSGLTQLLSWNLFVGSGLFCMKGCYANVTSPNYCQNIFDLIGCSYNMPATYIDGEFTSCEGELQDPVGTYTSNGQTLTWSQPASLDPSTTLPWTPRIPASSNCVTYSSQELFGTISTSTTGSASTATKVSSSSGSAAGSSPTNGAGRLVMSSGLFALLGAVVALI